MVVYGRLNECLGINLNVGTFLGTFGGHYFVGCDANNKQEIQKKSEFQVSDQEEESHLLQVAVIHNDVREETHF